MARIARHFEQVANLAVFGGQTALPRLAEILASGSVVGSALQFVVQLPAVMRAAPGIQLTFRKAGLTYAVSFISWPRRRVLPGPNTLSMFLYRDPESIIDAMVAVSSSRLC